MNRTDYEALLKAPAACASLPVSLVERLDQDRTLLYGYTAARHTLHVYLQAGVVHSVLHAHDGYLLAHARFDETIEDPERKLPHKRLYPESCDAQFCHLLRALGVYLSFTTFADDGHERRLARTGTAFAGLTAEALSLHPLAA